VVRALQPLPDVIANNASVTMPSAAINWGPPAMLSKSRLFWLTPLEWSLLVVSVALCGYLALSV
jgi:hypothetical protein